MNTQTMGTSRTADGVISDESLPPLAGGNAGSLVAASDAEMRWMTIPKDDMKATLRQSLYPGATDEMILAVMAYCKAARLNVMLRPVHIVPMWIPEKKIDQGGRQVKLEGTGMMRDVIMPSINHYRTQAHRTGRYMGLGRPEWGPTKTFRFKNNITLEVPESVAICVKVRDADTGAIVEYWHEERFLECYATAGRETDAPNAMWMKRPTGQMAKTAEAGALRKGFPELGDYTAEEMEGRAAPIDLIRDDDGVHRPAQRQAAASHLDTFAGGNGKVKGGGKTPDAGKDHTADLARESGKHDEAAREANPTAGLPTEETGEVLVMPEAASEPWKTQGKWALAWKWLNEAMPTLGPLGRQAMAEEHAVILHAVRGGGKSYQKAATAFVKRMGVTVPAIDQGKADTTPQGDAGGDQ